MLKFNLNNVPEHMVVMTYPNGNKQIEYWSDDEQDCIDYFVDNNFSYMQLRRKLSFLTKEEYLKNPDLYPINPEYGDS